MFLSRRFVKFLIVGIVNTLVGFLIIFTCLNVFKLGYFVSTIIGYVSGNIIGYILNRYFTFNNREKIYRTYWKFLVVFVVSYILAYYSGIMLAEVLSSYFGFIQKNTTAYDNIAVLGGAFVYVIVNFLGNSVFTFKQQSNGL